MTSSKIALGVLLGAVFALAISALPGQVINRVDRPTPIFSSGDGFVLIEVAGERRVYFRPSACQSVVLEVSHVSTGAPAVILGVGPSTFRVDVEKIEDGVELLKLIQAGG